MKYMLMMHSAGQGAYQIAKWPKKDIEAHIGFMIDFAKRLRAGGELVSAEGLGGPDQAKYRSRRPGRKARVTDGVFPETKEFLVGYWIVDVERAERAYAIAGRGLDGAGAGRQAAEPRDRGARR